MRIAVNGFGRIGKTFVRTLLADSQAQQLELVAINVGPGDPETVGYMLTYDTLLGTYSGSIEYSDSILTINGKKILIFSQPDPSALPWSDLKIDWVIEAWGVFTDAAKALEHCQAGAKHVLITAPAHNEDVTIIPGVNEELFNPAKHRIVSLGSCTTNAFVTALKVLNDAYELSHVCMTTVHAYTNSQELLDVNAHEKDPRKSRAAALNIIPTSTGASGVTQRVLPSLKGKVVARALRVPVAVVSFLDVTFTAVKSFTAGDLNSLFTQAASARMKDIIAVSDKPLVSSDYRLNSHSVTIDLPLTETCGPMGKIYGWYDNEWGYSCRIKDFLLYCSLKG